MDLLEPPAITGHSSGDPERGGHNRTGLALSRGLRITELSDTQDHARHRER